MEAAQESQKKWRDSSSKPILLKIAPMQAPAAKRQGNTPALAEVTNFRLNPFRIATEARDEPQAKKSRKEDRRKAQTDPDLARAKGRAKGRDSDT
jgi:hypothetical protein